MTTTQISAHITLETKERMERYVRDNGVTPFTRRTPTAKSSGSGRLDLPYPGRLLSSSCH